MSTYITPSSDITEFDVNQFIAASDSRMTNWLASTENEINALAYEHDLDADGITFPLHPIVKEYACAYYCYLVFRDNVGATNPETPVFEKYRVKFEMYASECSRMRRRCTKSLLLYGTADDATSAIERAPVNTLVRG